MRAYTLPDEMIIDLDQVLQVGKLFINKNDPVYNCYEVYMANGTSFNVFQDDLKRDDFLVAWSGSNG